MRRTLCVAVTPLALIACSFDGSGVAVDASTAADSGGLIDSGAADAVAASCVEPPDGIVRWWDGEVLGVDIADGATEIATALGAPTIIEGLVGNAVNFGAADVLVVATPPTSSLFTIEAWVLLESGLADDWIGLYGRFAEASFTAFDDRVAFWDGTFGGASGNLAIASTSLVGAWHHVAVTWDGTTVRSYVDGTLEAMQAPSGAAALPTNPAGIGGLVRGDNDDQLEDPFVGSIDELTIYDRALSDGEIDAIAAAGAAGKCKTL